MHGCECAETRSVRCWQQSASHVRAREGEVRRRLGGRAQAPCSDVESKRGALGWKRGIYDQGFTRGCKHSLYHTNLRRAPDDMRDATSERRVETCARLPPVRDVTLRPSVNRTNRTAYHATKSSWTSKRVTSAHSLPDARRPQECAIPVTGEGGGSETKLCTNL